MTEKHIALLISVFVCLPFFKLSCIVFLFLILNFNNYTQINEALMLHRSLQLCFQMIQPDSCNIYCCTVEQLYAYTVGSIKD